jgi:hypothetical protein
MIYLSPSRLSSLYLMHPTYRHVEVVGMAASEGEVGEDERGLASTRY